MKNPELISSHPILEPIKKELITFYYNGKPLKARTGEMITSALAAYGIYNIGKNPNDKNYQGLFCANGMCNQCRVIANNEIVKGCMTPVTEGMKVYSIEELPNLTKSAPESFPEIYELQVDVIIIGGGPAGLSAAITLASNKSDIKILIVDDKQKPGGKLLLQTHKFFGSKEDCYAGTRGFEIAKILENEVKKYNNIKIMSSTYFIGAFNDSKVGLYNGEHYFIIKTKYAILTTGAREKFLTFKGNHLPGIFGAGAFQTLLNRDQIKCSDKIFIIGGGNVGLIAAYHAIQAGIKVVGICDAAAKVSGYKVHLDKIKRYGIPIYLNHVVVEAIGNEKVEKITISPCDSNFNPTYKNIKTFDVDNVLVAVGLKENNEIEFNFKESNIKLYKAGDANEIAEASSAMFSGKLAALNLLKDIGENISIDDSLYEKEKILKSPGGKIYTPEEKDSKNNSFDKIKSDNIFPNLICFQEIPCNPCVTSCPVNAIKMDGDPILDLPQYKGGCIGCMQCVAICPGLAITLVNKKDEVDGKVKVTISFEFDKSFLPEKEFKLVDYEGNFLGIGNLDNIKYFKKDKRYLVTLLVDKSIATKVASFRLPLLEDIEKYVENKIEKDESQINEKDFQLLKHNTKNLQNYVCTCERVTVDEVRNIIRMGISDINFIKAATRLSMGACGGKTCSTTIVNIFREEKINKKDIIYNRPRPLTVEVPIKAFAGKKTIIKFKDI